MLTFLPPRRPSVPRPIRSPTAVAPGNIADAALRLAKLAEESSFNRLAGHYEASLHSLAQD
jgi:hypothetical protein